MSIRRILLTLFLAAALGLSISACAAKETPQTQGEPQPHRESQPAAETDNDAHTALEHSEKAGEYANLDTAAALSAIDESLNEMLTAAKSGDYKRAEDLRAEAYLIFE